MVVEVVVAEHNPRERRGSLMVFDGTIRRRGGVVVHHMVRMTVGVVVGVVVCVVARRVVVILRLLGRLALVVLFVLHPPVLEPYFHLTLREVEVSR